MKVYQIIVSNLSNGHGYQSWSVALPNTVDFDALEAAFFAPSTESGESKQRTFENLAAFYQSLLAIEGAFEVDEIITIRPLQVGE